MKVILIRHGATAGNLRRCYLGSTDQPLLPESRQQLESRSYPTAERVVASPLLRCRQTAEAVYGMKYEVCEDLRECDFGGFENKNHRELLAEDPYYQVWLDSGGTLPFPGGEDPQSFAERTVKCFLGIMKENTRSPIALVVHGGTVKCILEAVLNNPPAEPFYFWSVKNGGCLVCDWDGKGLTLREQLY